MPSWFDSIDLTRGCSKCSLQGSHSFLCRHENVQHRCWFWSLAERTDCGHACKTCACVQGTDELISSSPHEMPCFSARIGALAEFTKRHPDTIMVDPIERVQQVCCLLGCPDECYLVLMFVKDMQTRLKGRCSDWHQIHGCQLQSCCRVSHAPTGALFCTNVPNRQSQPNLHCLVVGNNGPCTRRYSALSPFTLLCKQALLCLSRDNR